MTTAGRPIASGRSADVFDQGDGTVLRRYRSDRDSTLEGRVMSWLEDRGMPVPAVHHAAGRDLIMDRVPGPTLLEDLQRRPWTLLGAARTLATLQRRLSLLDAPGWLPGRAGVPSGRSVLHLDLHPMNVIVSPEGPVVIDWTNVARGPASFDASMTVIIMSAFETSGTRDRIAQKVLVSSFSGSRGRSLVRTSLAETCRFRLLDPNVTDGERQVIERMLARSR